jgi:hypothetical protein
MREVRTHDTHGPGRQTVITLALATGEELRLVLGAAAARSLLETLLRQPHLRNVAAAMGQPSSSRAPSGAGSEGTAATGADRAGARPARERRRARGRGPSERGESPLRLVSCGDRRDACVDAPRVDGMAQARGRSGCGLAEICAGRAARVIGRRLP